MIPFPRQLRVVPIVPFDVGPAPLPGDDPGAVIEHDGRIYDLAGLLRELASHQLREIGSAAPRSAQELWDEAVRRWPALTAEIVAGAAPVG